MSKAVKVQKKFGMAEVALIFSIAILVVVVAVPVIMIFLTAFFKDGHFNLAGVVEVLRQKDTYLALKNSLIIAMSVPAVMIVLPIYAITASWRNAPDRLIFTILMIFFRVPYTTVFLLNFFQTLSRSYEEAAAIDGCSPAGTFWRIMFPLVQPALVTVTIFNFLGIWNEFFMALIFASSQEVAPVGVGLLQIVNSMKYTGQYGALFAAVIIVFLPTFLLYIFLSERIIAGVTGGGVKG